MRRNIILNYISQIYVTLIGILILPIYLSMLGAEAYGLVGFFTLLQSWFVLLDLGLSSTISRETARYKAGVFGAIDYLRLFRSLSLIFSFIALIGGMALFLSSNYMANTWLTIETLKYDDVVFCLYLMSIIVPLRWMCGLFRGVIIGSEKISLLSYYIIFISTLRFVLVIAILDLFGRNIEVFFIYQTIIAIFECVGYFFLTRNLLPDKKELEQEIGWSIRPIKNILKFSLIVAFTSSTWVMITQTDKLLLSGMLSLSEYAYFSIAVLVAGGILVLSGPVSMSLMPRMTSLYAQGKIDEMYDTYISSTRLIAIVAGSATIVLVVLSRHILFAWSADHVLADKAASVLSLYALGNLFLTFAAFPYYLQYAIGRLKLHFVGNVVFSLILIPLIIVSTKKFGSEGAAWVWMLANAFFFTIWSFIIHRVISKSFGLHKRWLYEGVSKVIIAPIIFGLLLYYFFNDLTLSRIYSIIVVVFVSLIMLLISILSSNETRKLIKWGSLRGR